MLLDRIKTGVLLILFFVSVIHFFPAWFLYLVALAMILLASWEYFEITHPKQPVGERLFCFLLAALFPSAAFFGNAVCVYGALFICFWLLSLRSLFSSKELRTRTEDLQNSLFGLIYISFGFSHFLLLRHLAAWEAWIFTILLAAYVGDIAAYFCGSYLGKRKFFPILSPKKTIEGAVGGLLASILAVYIFKIFIFTSLSDLQAVLVAALLAVSGQAGDLVESLIKRSYGVKDSGNILPGHGGILDRIDSILLAGPVGYYIAALFELYY